MNPHTVDLQRIERATPPGAMLVVGRIRRAGGAAYLVGGCLRDLLLGRPVKDWDLATDLTPKELRPLFRRVHEVGARFGTLLVPAGGAVYEVTTFRTEREYSDGRHPDGVAYTRDLTEDLRRRDFTINAMAWTPGAAGIVDPHGGLSDLALKRIRAVGEPRDRFREDALRLLRAVRQATELDFRIDEPTFAALREEAAGLRRVSAERVRDELTRILQAPRPSRGLRLLRETGLLALILPELDATFGAPQNRFHAYDVFHHSLYTADAAPADDLIVRWAALLHDIAKPQTAAAGEGETERTFYGHQVLGARLARRILRRLRYSNEQVERISHLVYHHMFYFQTEWTDSAIRRFVRAVGLENIPDLIALRLADMAGNGRRGGDRTPMHRLLQRVEEVMQKDAALTVKDLAIGGHDLMALGLAPGPGFGRILRALLEQVLDHPELNEREALLAEARALAARGVHLEPDAHERGAGGGRRSRDEG
ncbi:MAG: CCA tRNA nucleotidyltransferase [Candidatus Eisenbacteria bacterium]|uniref:CCA tRNA nucleotidyltransferase n=1 Tax=Eiseniibacteriota bacterium TaxID=2212470 RepID=A0A938BR39_UNCEI|nr:CCA tRNA nucleotidyltransferase [Candidatus Eisenbacteria bacterium]